MAHRQRLTIRNKTDGFGGEYNYGRKLKLIWGGDTHQGDSLESILEVGQEDTKKSKRTNNANFEVEIFREKNGEWIASGNFSEHVSAVISGVNEHYTLEALPHQAGWLGLYRVGEDLDMELIKRFKVEEW